MLNNNDNSYKATSEKSDSANPENMSKEELWAAIEEILDAADGVHIDIDKLESYHAQLQKIDPVMPEYSAEKAFNDFQDKFPELFEPEDNFEDDELEDEPEDKPKVIRKSSVFRRLATVAAVVAILLVVSPAVTGRNPIKVIFDWGNEIFTASGPSSGVLELPPEVEGEYRTFTDAVTSVSGQEIACPTWIPEDYSLSAVEIDSSSNSSMCSATYVSERGKLSFYATIFYDDSWSSVLEKNKNNGDVFSNEGVEYYLTNNYDIINADWYESNVALSITGNITEDELTNIIKSIK